MYRMISVDCRSVVAYPTGLRAYQMSLAKHLPDIAHGWHFQFLRHRAAPGRLTFSPNAHEVFVPGDPESIFAPLRLGKLFDARGLVLFHATGGLFPKGIDAPIITTIHDVLWITDPQMLRPPGLRGRVTTLLCRRYLHDALRRSARLIVPSEATRRAIDDVAPFVSDRVRLIHHGVAPGFVPLDRNDHDAAARARQIVSRLLSGAPRFVMDVGRSAPYRNHLGLVRAFASAFKSDPSIHLVFVQAMGDQTRLIMRLAARLGIDGRVHLLSGVSSRDLVALYQTAICVCHPSLHEAYGTVVAEAMACGCPVITSGRAAAGEVAEGVAQFVNPEHEDEIAAALRRVAYEPGVADRLRARGLQRAETLSSHRMAQETWKVYEEVLEVAAAGRKLLPAA